MTALVFCALVSVATTIGIIVMLIVESWGFFADDRIEILKFLTGTKWTVGQTQGALSYGIWPLLSGTLRITDGVDFCGLSKRVRLQASSLSA